MLNNKNNTYSSFLNADEGPAPNPFIISSYEESESLPISESYASFVLNIDSYNFTKRKFLLFGHNLKEVTGHLTN